ncbi:hypothetical protein CMI37_12415 [Candidatus Pacearchaeota archaeon]|nr:hypothetical protein [Candidatus Pacearchaeota archaeon]|tara:strand:- start:1741 stop:3171 length:1431 start_codon:yes stop_codon:yes gene_type:complete
MADIKEALGESTKYKKGNPLSTFSLAYDSAQNQLEPVYYWLLDFMQGDLGMKSQKITDNFTSSPGSGHFAEMGQRLTRLQEEGMKIYGLLNQTIKNVINLLYDLKEFEIRLAHYKEAKSKDEKEKEAGLLSLKQIWLDNVDMKRGRGAIHQMANEMGFTTLREAFMIANNIDDLKKMAGDEGLINEQVMRILIPRLAEFLKWQEYSEKELRKRFKIEKTYLKTQVETIKLQASWIRPYLKAAEELRQKGFDKNPALVNAFSTTMFELTLLGKRKINFEEEVKSDNFPSGLRDYKLKRDYYSCILIKMEFRGHVGQRVTQKGDYSFALGGRVDMSFDSYALNEEELELFEKELAKQDIEESFNFIENTAEESLEQLKEDIDHFLLKEDDLEKEETEKKKQDDTNPFSALFGLFKPSDKKKKEKKEIAELKEIKKDNFVEKQVREFAVKGAKTSLAVIYDIYKKSHGMASAPGGGFIN